MAKAGHKKLGRRKAGTYGRTHGPKGSNFSQKRVANKATRRERPLYLHLADV